jgi:hypothetical protein
MVVYREIRIAHMFKGSREPDLLRSNSEDERS